MVSNNTNNQFYRTVRIKMNLKQRDSYIPFHKGIDIVFHPHYQDGVNLKFHPGFDYKKINWVDATLTCCSVNPNPLHARDGNDLDKELAYIDSKYGIIRENLSSSDNPELLHNFQLPKNFTRHATIMTHPYVVENDHLRSRATEIHKTIMNVEDIREMEQKFEKKKAFYKKSKIEYIEKLDPLTNKKYAEVEMGYISGND